MTEENTKSRILTILIIGVVVFGVSQLFKLNNLLSNQNKKTVNNSEIVLEVEIHPVRDSILISTERTDEEIKQLMDDVQRIWRPANIKFVLNTEETKVSDTTSRGINAGRYREIHDDQELEAHKIHVFFIKRLIGENGTSTTKGAVFVGDNTTLEDSKVTAHQIGKILGLSPTLDSRERLMFENSDGVDLVNSEILSARFFANQLKLNAEQEN